MNLSQVDLYRARVGILHVIRYAKDEPKQHDFASTQLDIETGGYTRTQGSPIDKLKEISKSIPDAELAEDGKETDYHVTALYGLHADSPDEVTKLVAEFRPVEIEFGELSLFPANKGQEQRGGYQYDVLKIDIKGDDIIRLNKLLRKMEHTSTFPDYHPHMTIAYLKPGEGEKYIGKCSVTGMKLSFDKLQFSGKDRTKTAVALVGK